MMVIGCRSLKLFESIRSKHEDLSAQLRDMKEEYKQDLTARLRDLKEETKQDMSTKLRDISKTTKQDLCAKLRASKLEIKKDMKEEDKEGGTVRWDQGIFYLRYNLFKPNRAKFFENISKTLSKFF